MTLDQLQSATVRQVTLGGRLSANLVEPGFLKDQDLRATLPSPTRARTVLLLYGEGPRAAALAARQADLTRAALRAWRALQILLLRNRLLDMAGR